MRLIIAAILAVLAVAVHKYSLSEVFGVVGPLLIVWLLVALVAFILTGATWEQIKYKWRGWRSYL